VSVHTEPKLFVKAYMFTNNRKIHYPILNLLCVKRGMSIGGVCANEHLMDNLETVKTPSKYFLLALIIVLITLSACTISDGMDPRVATQTYQALDAIAEATVHAIQSQEAQATVQASTPSLTLASGPATVTPTPIYTPTPAVPIIEVSLDSNCRSGPGKVYDMVGALLVGETTEILARGSVLNYWVVDNPDYPGHECWLWGKYATVSGDTSLLPIRSVAPTPIPSPGSIRGYAYIDGNHNGQRGDSVDGHISGANLFLKEGACPGTTTFATASSSSVDGSYSFFNVPAGKYCLWRDLNQQTFDPDFHSIDLAPGENRTEVNFRYLP
jgi:hypothetical protein